MVERKQLDKKGYKGTFDLVGKVVLGDNSFKLKQTGKNNSNYVYNSLSLGVDCGNNIFVYNNMMDGYFLNSEKTIYAHGKDADGRDDYKVRVEVSWNNRFNPEVLKDVGNSCFIRVKLNENELRYLSAYDAIEYLSKNLVDGTVVHVRGNIVFSENPNSKAVQYSREITLIEVSNAQPENFHANAVQTALFTKDAYSEKDIQEGVEYIPLKGYVIDYVSKFRGTDYKGLFAFPFEFAFKALGSVEQTKAAMKTLFNIRKNVDQITFKGEFVEGGNIQRAKVDELSDELKALIQLGVVSEEEASVDYTNGNRERKFVLTMPLIVSQDMPDGTKSNELDRIVGKYSEDDLLVDISVAEKPSETLETANNVLDAVLSESNDADTSEADAIKALFGDGGM